MIIELTVIFATLAIHIPAIALLLCCLGLSKNGGIRRHDYTTILGRTDATFSEQPCDISVLRLVRPSRFRHTRHPADARTAHPLIPITRLATHLHMSSRQNPLRVTSCYCYGMLWVSLSGGPIAFQGFAEISILKIKYEAKIHS